MKEYISSPFAEALRDLGASNDSSLLIVWTTEIANSPYKEEAPIPKVE